MIRFTKMHGLGNDYIYLDCTKQMPEHLEQLAVKLSDRHFGVGSDGLICICPSQIADFKMRMFNADGSEGAMCGNGIRCVGKFVYDKGLTSQTELTVETLGGIKSLRLWVEEGSVRQVSVAMGVPAWEEPISLDVFGKTYSGRPVSMGNPHLVVYQDAISQLPLPELGPVFEHCPHFPDRTNTEFVEVQNSSLLSMRVWERGSGETMACGTGACAAAVCAMLDGLTDHQVTVRLLGGELSIRWEGPGHQLFMTGPAVTVFEGTTELA